MNDIIEERPLFEEGDVKITNRWAVFGTKTYDISNIKSVHGARQESGDCLSFLLIVGGLISLFPLVQISFVIFDRPEWVLLVFIGNVVAIALGFHLRKSAKPSFIVRIESISGVTVAYSSQSKALILNIVKAIEEILKGEYEGPLDVFEDLFLTPDEAKYGITRIFQIEDRKAQVRIPPEVKNGTKVRVRGKGKRYVGKENDGVGDLYLVITIIDTPK